MAEYSKPAQLLLNDRPVLKIDETDATVTSRDNAVYTLESGLDGFSDGATEIDITLKQAIPLNGWQIDWVLLAATHTTIRPSIKLGGKRYDCEGRVMTARFGSKVNDPNKVDVSIKAKIVAIAADA